MGDGRAAGVACGVEGDAGARVVGGRWVGDAGPDGFGAVRGGVIGGVAVDVGVVEDVQGREVLPGEAGRVFGAVADVRGQHGPGPGLGPAVLEPDVHGG